MALLNKLKDLIRGGGAGLPTTANNGYGSSNNYSQLHRGSNYDNDGSAKSIRIHPTLRQAWQRTPVGIQRTYMIAVACLFLIWMGWRNIRYQHAYVNLNCSSTDCFFRIKPVGWKRPMEITIARRQLVDILPVKTLKDGTFVTDENVKLDYGLYPQGGGKKQKKKNSSKKSSSYKGPDEDGYYVSYEFILRNKSASKQQIQPNENDDKPIKDENDIAEQVSLEPLFPYMTPTANSKDKSSSSGENNNAPTEFRLIVRQFRVVQSRRRIRSMISKISSYIRQRRQNLIVKESATPSWQGIIMLVLGVVGFLLCVLLGQLWESEQRPLTYQERRKQLQQQRLRQTQREQQKQQQQQRSTRRTVSSGSGTGVSHSRRPLQDAPGDYSVVPPRGGSQTAATTRKRY